MKFISNIFNECKLRVVRETGPSHVVNFCNLTQERQVIIHYYHHLKNSHLTLTFMTLSYCSKDVFSIDPVSKMPALFT